MSQPERGEDTVIVTAVTKFELNPANDAMRAGCPAPPGKQYALDPGKPLKPRKLAELPPAEGYQAVLRTDEKGCLDPLLVKDRLRQSR